MSLKQVGAEALQPVGQGWQDSKAVRQYRDAAAHCISELTATQLLPLEAQEGQVSRASQRQVSAVLLDGLNKLSNALKGKAHEQIHTFIPQTGAAPFSRQQVTLLQPSLLQRTLLTCRDAQSRTTAVTQLPGLLGNLHHPSACWVITCPVCAALTMVAISWQQEVLLGKNHERVPCSPQANKSILLAHWIHIQRRNSLCRRHHHLQSRGKVHFSISIVAVVLL